MCMISHMTLWDWHFFIWYCFFEVVAYINSLFLFIIEQCSMVWMYCCLFNLSLIKRYLGFFQFGDIANKPAMNSCLQVFM